MVRRYRYEKHIGNGQITDVFFIGYFCLLIITTNAIIKANVMIDTDTRPVKSSFIINNNALISTIRLTSSYVGGKPHLLILISCKQYYTVFIYKKQVNIIKYSFFYNNYYQFFIIYFNYF